MKCIVYIGASLDGYIADRKGGVDWLMESGNSDENYGYLDLMARVDALLMGRKTFEFVSGMDPWPYEKPVYLLSNSLSEIPERLSGKVAIVSGDLEAILMRIEADGVDLLYVDGGKTVQSFLARDLIDEITITTAPIILGGGTPLFGLIDFPLTLELMNSRSWKSGMVQSTYLRSK